MIGQQSTQRSFLGTALKGMLSPANKWVILANKIPWQRIEDELSKYYCQENGRPSLSIRRMTGLLLIKQIENISDERLVDMWRENVYWQYFCGQMEFQQSAPCVASELSMFRKRIGNEGVDFLFQISVGLHGKKAEETRVFVDSTVQEKNITYPTDSKHYLKILSILHRIIQRHQLKPRRSYVREMKELRERIRFFHLPSKAKAARKALKRLRTIAGALLRDVERKLAEADINTDAYTSTFALFRQILRQEKDSKNKVYSIHEPHVECFRKGKAHKKNEFGKKATIIRTAKSKVIIGVVSHEKNAHDSKCLQAALQHANANKEKPIEQACCDKGYRGAQKVEDAVVLIPGIPKYSGNYSKSTLQRIFRKRAGIEATIGHLKADFRLGRNFLKGQIGDEINLCMACCAYNLKLLVNNLNFLFFAQKYVQLFAICLYFFMGRAKGGCEVGL